MISDRMKTLMQVLDIMEKVAIIGFYLFLAFVTYYVVFVKQFWIYEL